MHGFKTKYFTVLENDKIRCDLCPRFCTMKNGQRGLCYVRGAQENEIRLYTYGKSSGFCIDPIEKKPLNHFYPGEPVLSFGTAGCNLACKFCQNWDISKSREMDTLQSPASPKEIVQKALEYHCKSIAFTYNDPVIFLEYAKDVAYYAHQNNIRTVAVTAGYINPIPRAEFFSFIDAANVDLKAFTSDFYKKLTGGDLSAVLDTLKYIVNETNVWLEITTLLIPTKNDSPEEITLMCQWIHDNLGDRVPLHFSAFHPDFKMLDIPATPFETLTMARQCALQVGLKYVYTGNVHDPEGSSTYCPKCQTLLIERDWYTLGEFNIDAEKRCKKCHTPIDGFFHASAGQWGAKRLPIQL